jgi:hypothetical protein
MRKFKGADLAQVERIQPRLSVRTLLIATGMILFGLMYARTQVQRASLQSQQLRPEPEATVAKPVVVPGLFEGVLDSTQEERVRLEREELEVLKASARQLVPAHFELPEARPLLTAVAAELNAQPELRRADLISARGRLTHLGERAALAGGGSSEWFGSALTEEGLPFHFITLENSFPGSLTPGDWVRVDGLFMKLYSSEDPHSGQFVDGPLLVGRTLERSFEGLGSVVSLDPAFFQALSDDTLDDRAGLPELVRWLVLSWIRDMPAGAIDWENAPVLDRESMSAIVASGNGSRGQAFRVHVAQVQELSSKRLGENPARLSHITEGWLGNATWTAGQPVLTFIAPGNLPPVEIGTKVSAGVIFLKNIAYETVDGTRRLVPLFALHHLERFIVPEPLSLKRLSVAFIGFLAAMMVLLFVLVWHAQRRTAELQKQLVAARRQRERRTASSPV